MERKSKKIVKGKKKNVSLSVSDSLSALIKAEDSVDERNPSQAEEDLAVLSDDMEHEPLSVTEMNVRLEEKVGGADAQGLDDLDNLGDNDLKSLLDENADKGKRKFGGEGGDFGLVGSGGKKEGVEVDEFTEAVWADLDNPNNKDLDSLLEGDLGKESGGLKEEKVKAPFVAGGGKMEGLEVDEFTAAVWADLDDPNNKDLESLLGESVGVFKDVADKVGSVALVDDDKKLGKKRKGEVVEKVEKKDSKVVEGDSGKKKKFRFHAKSMFGTWPQCDIKKEEMVEFLKSKKAIRGIVCEEDHQKKEGEEGVGKHLHCWVEFDKPVDTLNSRYFDYKGFHCHVEVPQNKLATINYVKKGLNFVEFGEGWSSSEYEKNARKHKKNEINRVLLDGEMELEDFIYEYPDQLLRIGAYQKSLAVYRNLKANKSQRGELKCFWLWGDPGIGKSYLVKERFPGAYRKGNSKWWDGYVDQKVVILEDFDNKNLASYLKIWADNYKFIAETKGGTISPVYEVFIITSNYEPEDIFVEGDYSNLKKKKNDEMMCRAISRRFKIYNLVAPLNMRFVPKLPEEIDSLPY